MASPVRYGRREILSLNVGPYKHVAVVRFDPEVPVRIVDVLAWAQWVVSRLRGMTVETGIVSGCLSVTFAQDETTVTPANEAKLRELVDARFTRDGTATALIDRAGRQHVGTTVTFALSTTSYGLGMTADETLALVPEAENAMVTNKRTVALTMSKPTLDEEAIRLFANAAAGALQIQLEGPVAITDPDPHAQMNRAFDYREPEPDDQP